MLCGNECVFSVPSAESCARLRSWSLFFEVLDRAVSLCVSGAVRRDFDVAQPSEICAHAVSLRVRRFRWSRARSCHSRVARALCMCVCMFPVQSVASCACAVFFCVRWVDVSGALGTSASVDSWSWQCLCVCACVSGLVFVGGGVYGGCLWWRLQSVRRVSLFI